MHERPPFNATLAISLQTKFNVLLSDFQRVKTLIQGTLNPETVKEKSCKKPLFSSTGRKHLKAFLRNDSEVVIPIQNILLHLVTE